MTRYQEEVEESDNFISSSLIELVNKHLSGTDCPADSNIVSFLEDIQHLIYESREIGEYLERIRACEESLWKRQKRLSRPSNTVNFKNGAA